MDKTNAASKHTRTVRISTYGREISDERWEYIETRIIQYWKDASKTLRVQTFRLEKVEIKIEINLAPIADHFEKFIKAMKEIHSRGFDAIEGDPFPRGEIILTADITLPNNHGHVENILDSYLHDIFVFSNILVPSSSNMFRYTIESPHKHKVIKGSLSSTIFEVAYYSKTVAYVETQASPEEMVNWYYLIHKFGSQIPDNPLNKTFFALMQMARDTSNPTNIILIFYCLETIFETKSGENFRILYERICLLLNIDGRRANLLKKKLRSLYDIRSSIVHGGMQIIHPLHDETLDTRLDDKAYELITAQDFGVSLVANCIRTIFNRQWSSVKFNEVMNGVPIDR